MVVTKERDIGLDIIRSVAILCVVYGHFFSVNTPFNDVPLVGISMIFQGFLKSIFCNLGVPFFLMLSGYLCCKKEFSLGYYKGLKRILVPYLVISLITWGVLSSDYSLVELLKGVFGFKIIGYAWYIEMYLGLFLLMPFVNIVIRVVYESNDKYLLWALIATSILLTSLPTIVSRQGNVFLSRYWEMNFPITFYLIGAYIKIFQPQLSWKYLLPAIFILSFDLIISVLFGGELLNFTGAYYGLVNMAAVYILFVLFYQIKTTPCRTVITSISMCSLEMYLFSFVIDKTLYPVIIGCFYTTQSEFLFWFVPITCCLLILDYVCAKVLRQIINSM